MSEGNCQPIIHNLPDGTPVTLMPDGTTTCITCGFTWQRTEIVKCTLGTHLDRPSGRVRRIVYPVPVACPSCGDYSASAFLPCGADNLSQVFAREFELADKGE